ncbi:MAG: thioesterase family protein [Burkholderiales bacterium]|nr:thioesterase family protein [Burkholderiales bacterium]MDE2395299.1 thioesterase family protein [Burkholderiales bacterium]MDE2455909.1 thioesterase family protein [Burkholderiales bacterium]
MTQPLPRRDPADQARLESMLVQMFEQRIAFNQLLGLKVESLRAADTRMSFAMQPQFVGNFSQERLHGGVIAAALDSLGGLALTVAIAERHAHEATMQVLQRFAKMGTIDLRIDFLRPGISPRFEATAEVLRLGGRVGSTQMRLADAEGRLIATGAAAYIVS